MIVRTPSATYLVEPVAAARRPPAGPDAIMQDGRFIDIKTTGHDPARARAQARAMEAAFGLEAGAVHLVPVDTYHRLTPLGRRQLEERRP